MTHRSAVPELGPLARLGHLLATSSTADFRPPCSVLGESINDRNGWIPDLRRAPSDDKVAPIPAVRWTGRTGAELAAGSGYFVDAPLIVPIDNLWWRVPITL